MQPDGEIQHPLGTLMLSASVRLDNVVYAEEQSHDCGNRSGDGAYRLPIPTHANQTRPTTGSNNASRTRFGKRAARDKPEKHETKRPNNPESNANQTDPTPQGGAPYRGADRPPVRWLASAEGSKKTENKQ